MIEKNIGSNLDEFLSEYSMRDEMKAVAANRVCAWQIEQELEARWAEIESSKVELIFAGEVFADIRRKLQ